METKKCSRCGVEKPIEDFRFCGSYKGKRYRASDCRVCHAEQAREYRKQNIEACRQREREYGRKNAERKREVASAWYYANKERAAAQRTASYQRDPELVRDRAHQTRARRAGASAVELVRRREVYERDGGICHVCATAIDWADYELDHLVPLSEGGDHTYANVKAAHRVCNQGRRYT